MREATCCYLPPVAKRGGGGGAVGCFKASRIALIRSGGRPAGWLSDSIQSRSGQAIRLIRFEPSYPALRSVCCSSSSSCCTFGLLVRVSPLVVFGRLRKVRVSSFELLASGFWLEFGLRVPVPVRASKEAGLPAGLARCPAGWLAGWRLIGGCFRAGWQASLLRLCVGGCHESSERCDWAAR